MPRPEELRRFYQNQSSRKTVRWERRLKRVRRAFGGYLKIYQSLTTHHKPARMADIGGGVGYYCRAAEDVGIEAWLLDFAGDALQFAREQLGLSHVVPGDIQNCARHLEMSTFDLVIARHTIEHLPDPAAFLHNLRDLLVPGGLLIVETPNAGSHEHLAHPSQVHANYRIIRQSNADLALPQALTIALRKSMSGINPPKHLWGFTEKALALLMERGGFEILQSFRPILGHPTFDPLYYDINNFASRSLPGKVLHFWERFFSLFAFRNGANLAVAARRPLPAGVAHGHTH